jgi:hypothetical protein
LYHEQQRQRLLLGGGDGGSSSANSSSSDNGSGSVLSTVIWTMNNETHYVIWFHCPMKLTGLILPRQAHLPSVPSLAKLQGFSQV